MNNIIKNLKNFNYLTDNFGNSEFFLEKFDLLYEIGDFKNALRCLKLSTLVCNLAQLNSITEEQVEEYFCGNITSDFKIFYLIKCCEFLNSIPGKSFSSLSQKECFDDIILREYNKKRSFFERMISKKTKINIILVLKINYSNFVY